MSGRYELDEMIEPGQWRARDSDGNPAVVFELPATGASAPRRLANVWYQPPRPMILRRDSNDQQMSAAVLVCRASDSLLRDHFTRLAAAIFDVSITTELEIERRLDAFVGLLKALTAPPRQTAQGLWGELAIIAWARDADAAVDAWHAHPMDLVDFTNGGEHLEIKSCHGERREHEVSFDQLHQAAGQRVILGSLMVEEHDEGTSVGELVEWILPRLTTRARQRKVERLVYRTLGREWQHGTSVRIREDRARQSLRFYPAEVLPCIPRPLPAEISGVSYRIDLSEVEDMHRDRVSEVSQWWTALLGKAAT